MRSNQYLKTAAITSTSALARKRWLKYSAGATLLVGAILSGIGSNAHAQSSGIAASQDKYATQDAEHALSLIDTDSNGRISRSEAVAFRKVANYFDAADSNRDGMLSPQEFETALNGGRPR